MNHLDYLESRSLYIIRETFYRFSRPALLWSIGKDSTVLLWLVRKAFLGDVPFPVVHIDTSYEFDEVYKFRDKVASEWSLDLKVETNHDALKRGITYEESDAFTCSHELKTVALQKAIVRYNFDSLLVGIRRDEHGIRAKERVFSPRTIDFEWDYKNQAPEMWDQYRSQNEKGEHMRVHPLLHWAEIDIWRYIQREKIDVCKLYFANEGTRFRSLGCKPITSPVPSQADTIDKIIDELKSTKVAERSGRAQDKEQSYTMQKLRSLGYM